MEVKLGQKHIDFLFIIIPFTYSRQVVSKMEKYLLQLLFVHNINKNVATLLWPSVGLKPNTWKSWDLESSGTPECSELDNKTQNTSHWGVLGVIGKVLKRRYRKCPRIGN